MTPTPVDRSVPVDGHPDDETITGALRLACCAPSVHNTQPWRWRVGRASIHLFADQGRRLPATDPDGRDLLVSCGAALHHLVTALAAFGWRARIHRVPDPADPAHLAAVEVTPSAPTRADVVAASAILRRRSDRRAYAAWPVDEPRLAALAEAAAHAGVLARVVTGSERAELAELIGRAQRDQSTDDAYRTELALWSGRHAGSPDGVPAANTTRETRYGDLVTRRFSAPALDQHDRSAAGGAGALLVLGTASDDVVSRLRAGEAMSALTLAATALRLASCPLTQSLQPREIRARLRADVLHDAMAPQVLLRVGWPAPGVGELPRTPRRPLTDVLDPFDPAEPWVPMGSA
ncbi:nitroreductase family protein [Actinokineospora sp. NBRC 105648]|uniref:Acg family FMN-binding oxidoreductase n=1 Tax=Actinokineospora sp. NBRC 105648 TaxID=3032206 RepID=UPI0024A27E93|nr:nitroreductase family protein [Actinokineospora sp. NBRC 105648]GLZ36671.1 NAD(P)H nitroreductase [Actinokineospora sp. NBRC 105648]